MAEALEDIIMDVVEEGLLYFLCLVLIGGVLTTAQTMFLRLFLRHGSLDIGRQINTEIGFGFLVIMRDSNDLSNIDKGANIQGRWDYNYDEPHLPLYRPY
jgi:hypothetical protein